MEELKLTPSEDLVMETLAARRRLGNQVWTLEKRHSRTLKLLEEKGLVNFISGVDEKSVRASLTALGEEHYLDGQWKDPAISALEGEVERLKKELDSTTHFPPAEEVVQLRRRDPLAQALMLALAADLSRLAFSGLRTLARRKKS